MIYAHMPVFGWFAIFLIKKLERNRFTNSVQGIVDPRKFLFTEE